MARTVPEIYVQSRDVIDDYNWRYEEKFRIDGRIKLLDETKIKILIDNPFSSVDKTHPKCSIRIDKQNNITLCIFLMHTSRTDNKVRPVTISAIFHYKQICEQPFVLFQKAIKKEFINNKESNLIKWLDEYFINRGKNDNPFPEEFDSLDVSTKKIDKIEQFSQYNDENVKKMCDYLNYFYGEKIKTGNTDELFLLCGDYVKTDILKKISADACLYKKLQEVDIEEESIYEQNFALILSGIAIIVLALLMSFYIFKPDTEEKTQSENNADDSKEVKVNPKQTQLPYVLSTVENKLDTDNKTKKFNDTKKVVSVKQSDKNDSVVVSNTSSTYEVIINSKIKIPEVLIKLSDTNEVKTLKDKPRNSK